MTIKTLGQAIRLYRIIKNITQGELAERAGITVSYLSLIERGRREVKVITLIAIAKRLGVSMIDLIILASEQEDLDNTRLVLDKESLQSLFNLRMK